MLINTQQPNKQYKQIKQNKIKDKLVLLLNIDRLFYGMAECVVASVCKSMVHFPFFTYIKDIN